MKRLNLLIAIAIITAVLIGACASSGSSAGKGLPKFVQDARKEAPKDTLIGIGAAKLASMNQSKAVAETRARAEISRSMNTIVQDMVRDYQASSEVDPQAALSFQENITVALSRSELTGAVIHKEDYIDGTYYVVIHLSKADVVREISQAQAAARLQVPAMASFSAEERMNQAFDRVYNQDPLVNNRD